MTFRLTPQAAAALRTGRYPLAPMVEVRLPGHTMLHLVGAGEVDFGPRRFVSRDPLFGVLAAAGNLRDGVMDEAPEWALTFIPPDPDAIDDLTSATAQGGLVNGWLGVVDRATGLLLPEPMQVFAGELDVARVRVGKGSVSVEWRAVSALERFHDTERGARLSDAWHQLIWPGETGLSDMTGIEKTSYWGVEKPPSGITYGGGGFGGGGAGSFGISANVLV